jgi:hypothetical protein
MIDTLRLRVLMGSCERRDAWKVPSHLDVPLGREGSRK